WSNTGDRKIFLGWMSNWRYASRVPTVKWRSAMTIPRDLSLEKIDGKYFIKSEPVPELKTLAKNKTGKSITPSMPINNLTLPLDGPAMLSFSLPHPQSFTLTFTNDENEKLMVGFDSSANQYFIDRTQA